MLDVFVDDFGEGNCITQFIFEHIPLIKETLRVLSFLPVELTGRKN